MNMRSRSGDMSGRHVPKHDQLVD